MLGRIWTQARDYLPLYAVGLVLLLATNALNLTIPWLLRAAIDGMEREVDLGRVAAYAGWIAVCALAQAVTRTGSRLAVLGNSRRIVHDVRNRFFDRLSRLPAAFYDHNRTGDIMSRGINDLQLLRSLYGPGVMNALNTAIVYAATLVLLFRIDVTLTLASMALYPLLFVLVNRISRRVYARSRAVQEQLATISNRVQENLSGIQQIKIYVQEEREIDAFARDCAEFRRRNLAMTFARGWMLAAIGVVSGFGVLIVLWLGGRHVVEGRISFGDFVAFNAYLGLLTWPTVALGWIVNTIQRGIGAMERVAAVLDAPVEPAGAAVDGPPLDGPIEIRGLTFSYPGSDAAAPPALRDLSLRIPQGSRVAVVGPVGSGKSTLAQLLARVYPAPPGTLFFDGVDAGEISPGRHRRSVGYVPQEAFLFSRSLQDNIALGRRDATEDEVRDVLDLVRLDGEAARLPDGPATVVGERGVTLSGGQRQRATLARAILVDPRLLILDDALASVDADTEQLILEQLESRLEGRTSVLITHRLSALPAVDRIFVLDEGRLVESGRHDELIGAGGAYARLFERQRLEHRLEES